MTKLHIPNVMKCLLRPAAILTVGALSACGGGDGGNGDNPGPGGVDPGGPPVVQGQLRVTSSDARACEALVEARGGQLVSIEVAGGAIGKMVREGDRAGISIISAGSAPLPEVVATLQSSGSAQILSTACYDAQGQLVPERGSSSLESRL